MSHEPIDARFAEAWINYDHVVCGLRLRPYCLQHALLLTVLGNPLGVEDSKQEVTVGWEDLWEAVAVCCTAYEERPVFRGALRRMVSQRLRGLSLFTEVAKFRAYQNDYHAAPDLHYSDETDMRVLTAPAILSKVVMVQRHMSIPEERLWTMGIGKFLWIHATLLEQIEPKASLLDEDEGRIWDLLGKIQRGEASPDELPPEPNRKKREDALLARAKEILRT